MLAQSLQQKHEMDLMRAKIENEPINIESVATQAVYKMQNGVQPSAQEMAAIRTQAALAKDQTYVDEFGQRVTIPSPWRGVASQFGGGNMASLDPRMMPQLPQQGGDIYNQIMLAESGGNPNAVSPKGAFGLMQLMPETARDPGFGVTPMQNMSPQENMRVGRDYFDAMSQKYGGDTAKALAAYNYGPAAVDNLIQSGQYPQGLPQETKDYVQKVLGGLSQQTPPPQQTQATVESPKLTGPIAGTPLGAKMEAEAQLRMQEEFLKQKAKSDETLQGAKKFDKALSVMAEKYKKLDNMGGMVRAGAPVLDNLGASVAANPYIGQPIGGAIGTKGQALRDEIQNYRPVLTQTIKSATGMSAQEMNSNVELQIMLNSIGNVGQDYDTVMNTLSTMSQSYGAGGFQDPRKKQDNPSRSESKTSGQSGTGVLGTLPPDLAAALKKRGLDKRIGQNVGYNQ